MSVDSKNFAELFEDLRIWMEARSLATSIYKHFGTNTPAERDFGFRSQIERAAVSVMNNIAEGFEHRSPAEFSKYLNTAKASCAEARSMLYLAEDLGYTSSELAMKLRAIAEKISRGIASLDRTVRARI